MFSYIQALNQIPNSQPLKKFKLQLSVVCPRINNKGRSPYTPQYIEKFSVTLPQTKIHVSNVHNTTKKIDTLRFDSNEMSADDARLLETPRPAAGTHMLLVYIQYQRDQISTIFGKPYSDISKSWQFDTGSHYVRQKEQMYNTHLTWNVKKELVPKEFVGKGCKCMTFQWANRVGKFDKDCKKGAVYVEYFVNDVLFSGLLCVDMVITDGEPALQSVPKHVRNEKYNQFRKDALVPMLIQAINDALHNWYNDFKSTAKVSYNCIIV